MRHAFGFASILLLGATSSAIAGQPSQTQVLQWTETAKELRAKGDFQGAASLYERALAEAPRVWGEGSANHAIVLNQLALAYKGLGQYTKAEPLYRRSLEIREARVGKSHPDTATALNNLAVLYRAMGQHAKAEPLQRRCVEIREATLGPHHAETAAALGNLAALYYAMGEYAKSEPLYKRTVEISMAALGKDHLDTALALNNLGLLYLAMEQYAKAEPLFQRSLEIGTKLGANTTSVLNNLAILYQSTGQFVKAEPLYRRSLEIREAKLGKDHLDTINVLHNLAWNQASQERWTDAVELAQRARQAMAGYLAELLPVLTENEQLAFLEHNYEWHYFKALSLGLAAPKTAANASAEWLLNGKAVAHRALAEQYLLARDARSPQAKQLVDALQQVRTQLAGHHNRVPKAGLETQHQRDVQDLKTREQDLAQKLARAVGRAHRTDPWVKLAELQSRLGPKTAFLDIARFRLHDFRANKSLGYHYVAWITPPQGDVQLIDLGKAEAIDALVAEARKALIDSARAVTTLGEAEAVSALDKPFRALSAKVLHPLLPALEKYEDWIVCPDGALWLTPWNALLLPDGKYVVEKHLVRHVVSGRDLVLDEAKNPADGSYLFADPDYDLTPGKVHAAAGSLRGVASPLLGQRLRGVIGTWNVSFEFLESEVVIYDEDDKGTVAGKGTWKHEGDALTMQTGLSQFQGTMARGEIRGDRTKRAADGNTARDGFRIALGDDTRAAGAASKTLPRFGRLPGTALEAEAVRPNLHKWLDKTPQLFLEDKASELLVKSLKHPRVLVLATHGYFLPVQRAKSRDKERLGLDIGSANSVTDLDDQGQPIENPLLRCGLLLAGCNKRSEAKPGEDDGILTGLEIVGMDLRGTELVVLSACETGLGDVRNGEGVAGLRQAFQLAGAKGVLASLWQVPDRETALLMNAFYGELTKGKSQAAALREAQLSRIAARRANFGAAHPFFWAAFTLTGRGAE